MKLKKNKKTPKKQKQKQLKSYLDLQENWLGIECF